MKKTKMIAALAILSATLCACETNTPEEVETMSKNREITEDAKSTEESTELDKDSFASGIKASEESSTEKESGSEKETESEKEPESEKATESEKESESEKATESEKESESERADEPEKESESEKATEAESATEKGAENGIEERCPAKYLEKRKDVNYGSFTHGTYESKTCGLERGYSILLPADYSEEKQYPVLYLLHGIFGDEYSFANDSGNKIKELVGNVAADGVAPEMIVVCPNMYAATDPNQKPGFDAKSCLPYDNFINDLVDDLMPYIESHYSVKTGRENTYLAGFSMGGRETIFITLQRPELFGYVSAISAAPGIVETKDKFMSHPGQLDPADVKFQDGAVEPEVFLLCCGSKDSVVGTYPKSYHELLTENGSEHLWYEISGADHDNNAILSGLYNLFHLIGEHQA